MGLTVAELEQEVNFQGVARIGLLAEVTDARGTAGTLGARLDVALNPDGTPRTSVTAAAFVTEVAPIIAYPPAGEYVALKGDLTAVYVAKRRLRINGALLPYVTSSTYDAGGDYTVVNFSTPVGYPITSVEYSFDPAAMPPLHYSGNPDIEQVVSGISTLATKHISDAQYKSLLDDILARVTVTSLASVDDGAGVDLVGRAFKYVDIIDDLRTLTPTDAPVYVQGRTTIDDGGQGTFVWSTADLSAKVAADPLHGIYVAPTSDPTGASGAWVRQFTEVFLFAPWFGAKTGGDVSVALQAAANMAEALSVKEVRFPAGKFTITSKVYFACDDAAIRGDLYVVSGAGQTATVLECRTANDYALFGSRLQLKNLKLNGPGKNNGDNVSGIKHHPAATVTKGRFENVEFTNLSGEAWRSASVYGWECSQVRVEVNNSGFIIDSNGPFGSAASTGLTINDSYFASNNTYGLKFDGGVFNTAISNTYFEYNDIGIVANAGTSITLENTWFEGNTTNGLQGFELNVKILGTIVRQGAGDAFSISYAGGTVNPAEESLQQALSQDIVWRDKTLGHRSSRSGLTNYHVFNAVGEETGLRDKYPRAKLTPSITVDLFVKSDGSLLTEDTYGITVTKTGTGVYSITWGTLFNLGPTEAKLPIVLVSPVAGNLVGTSSPRIAAWQYVGSNVSAHNVAGSIVVRTYDIAGAATDCAFSVSIDFRLGNGSGLSPDFNLFGRDTTP